MPVLPKSSADSTSVTFIISSTDPPRATQNFQQLPYAEEVKPLPSKTYSDLELRQFLGDLVYSVSNSMQRDIGSNKKQFEAGQTLEFGDNAVSSVTNDMVPNTIDLQQNTNLLDLSSLGLTNEEITMITTQAEERFNIIVNQINDLKSSIRDNETAIQENQKSLNEVRKAIKATAVALDVDPDATTDVPDVLKGLIELEATISEGIFILINDTNALNEEVSKVFQQLLELRELVR